MNFQIERLEERLLLAASVRGKNLIVDGTSDADSIIIRGTGLAGEVEVSVDNGATFDTFSGVKNIKVNTGDGNDLVDIYDIEIAGNLQIKTGGGDDSLYLSGQITRNVKIDMGAGDDYTQESIGDLIVGKNFSFKGGDGNDVAHYDQNISVNGNISFNMGKGDDTLIVSDAYDYHFNGRRISVKMGQGDDRLELENIVAPGARITLDGGPGNDVFDELGGHTFGKMPKLKGFETVNV